MSKHISLASYELEAAARAEGYAHVCGADEAGAGPLMGPVYAAAVILPEGCVIEGLDDSKKLSEKKRETLFDIIRERETLTESMPACWFVRNKSKITYEVISSTVTQDVLRTRREDNIDLFS